jgi:hypothetical protein
MSSTGHLREYYRSLVRAKFMLLYRPPSAPATSSLTPTHHPTSSGTHTDTYEITGPILSTVLMVLGRGSGGSTPGTPQLTSSSSKSKTNVGAIAGEVIGAVFAALVIIFVWLRCRKVRRLAADPASGSRFLRIEDYYATQDASPPSSTHQVNPFPVSVDRSVFKGGAPVAIFNVAILN